MAQLTWTSILSIGSRKLGESGLGRNTFIDFQLPSLPVVSNSALLILAAKDVHEERSYITINPPRNIPDDLNFDLASDKEYFVGRILSTGSHFTTQVHRVPNNGLKNRDPQNEDPLKVTLGIHSRAADGTTNGNLDDFEVARIFLVYSTPD